MHELLGKVVPLVIDDALHILEVNVALNNNQQIAGLASISDNDLVSILAISPQEHRLMLIIALIGDKFLIVAGLVKILDAVAELIAHVSIALAQVKHLHRSDAEAGFGQGGRQ